jgi:hypothetical protein
MKNSIVKTYNRRGPPIGLPPDPKYWKYNQHDGLLCLNSRLCSVFWHHRKIWLTCLNSVCQDFVLKTEPLSPPIERYPG